MIGQVSDGVSGAAGCSRRRKKDLPKCSCADRCDDLYQRLWAYGFSGDLAPSASAARQICGAAIRVYRFGVRRHRLSQFDRIERWVAFFIWWLGIIATCAHWYDLVWWHEGRLNVGHSDRVRRVNEPREIKWSGGIWTMMSVTDIRDMRQSTSIAERSNFGSLSGGKTVQRDAADDKVWVTRIFRIPPVDAWDLDNVRKKAGKRNKMYEWNLNINSS